MQNVRLDIWYLPEQEVFHERVKSYRSWKEAETMLAKKREAKTKFELQHKSDKVAQAQGEITEVHTCSYTAALPILLWAYLVVKVSSKLENAEQWCTKKKYFWWIMFSM